jgi:predicted ATPase
MVSRIVITGAPASGKTEFHKKLKSDLKFSEFIFFDELARQLLFEKPSYRQNWSLFHKEIYFQQTKREDDLDGKPFITDRGTVDAFAFHPETISDVGTTFEIEYGRYDAVIQLGSAANLGGNYYQMDKIRQETTKEAVDIENKIINVWKDHPGYIMIKAERDIDLKYKKFYNTMLELIG